VNLLWSVTREGMSCVCRRSEGDRPVYWRNSKLVNTDTVLTIYLLPKVANQTSLRVSECDL
jgi:hypothetical protein